MTPTVTPPAIKEKKPASEHIFPATHLTKLAIRWKELNDKGRHAEAMPVLEEIIIGSTQMFERLAQHEDFHYTVDLKILVAAAQEKVVRWLLSWKPQKGRLFSFFSKCAKNAFRSEIVKAVQYRKRYHVTSDNLESFFGQEDHTAYRNDAASELKKSIESISVRWGDPQEIGAIMYLISCVVEEDEIDKQRAIRSAAYAWAISPELSKFFYSWVLMELRDKMYAKVYIPFTQQDLFRHHYSYTHLVDLLNIITWEQLRKIIAVMGGTRLKIPTIAQMVRMTEDHKIFEEIDAGDKDPVAVEETAKKNKRSPRNAQEIYEEMVHTLHHDRTGEFPLYE